MRRTRVLIACAQTVLVTATALAADATGEAKPNRGLRTWAKAPVVANKMADVCQPFGYAGQRTDLQSHLGRHMDTGGRPCGRE